MKKDNALLRSGGSHAVGQLFRFMWLFEINRFTVFSASEKTIRAKIGWPDDGRDDYAEEEEVQEIEWRVQNIDHFDLAMELADFLADNDLMATDKITVGHAELLEKTGWDAQKLDSAVSALLSIRVDMIDDGEKTDFFFIHF
ncbi:MAG: hypothetical protein WBD13_07665 [Burkholderiaceae bacterium]